MIKLIKLFTLALLFVATIFSKLTSAQAPLTQTIAPRSPNWAGYLTLASFNSGIIVSPPITASYASYKFPLGSSGFANRLGTDVKLADLNGDNVKDIIIFQGANSVSSPNDLGRVHLIDGVTWSKVAEISATYGTFGADFRWGMTGAVLEDLLPNGDVALAVAVPLSTSANPIGRVEIYNATQVFNNPSISFSPVTTLFLPSGGSGAFPNFGHNVADIGDVNGDSFEDFAISNQPIPGITGTVPNLWVYLTNNSGFAFNVISVGSGLSHVGQEVIGLGDINGDSVGDFAYLYGGTSTAPIVRLVIRSGSATGSFGYIPVGNTVGTAINSGVLDTLHNAYPHRTALKTINDLNGDGKRDIVVGVASAGVYNAVTTVESGTGTVLQSIQLPAPYNAERGGNEISIGDFNGDGFDDIGVGVPEHLETLGASSVMSGAVLVLFDTRTNSTSPASFNTTPANTQLVLGNTTDGRLGRLVDVGDVDYDGQSEFLAAQNPYNYSNGTPGGTWANYPTYTSGQGALSLIKFNSPIVPATSFEGNPLCGGTAPTVSSAILPRPGQTSTLLASGLDLGAGNPRTAIFFLGLPNFPDPTPPTPISLNTGGPLGVCDFYLDPLQVTTSAVYVSLAAGATSATTNWNVPNWPTLLNIPIVVQVVVLEHFPTYSVVIDVSQAQRFKIGS